MTPNSSTVPYLTIPEMLLRHDARSVAQYVSDDPQNPVQVTDLPINQALLAAIDSAGGEVESVCLRAERYSASDLQSLTGQSQQFLKKIVANIAMFNLVTRRPGPDPPTTVLNNYEWSMKQLEALSQGAMIFGFVETEAAGLPGQYALQPVDQILNGQISALWPRTFGQRTNMQRNRWI